MPMVSGSLLYIAPQLTYEIGLARPLPQPALYTTLKEPVLSILRSWPSLDLSLLGRGDPRPVRPVVARLRSRADTDGAWGCARLYACTRRGLCMRALTAVQDPCVGGVELVRRANEEVAP